MPVEINITYNFTGGSDGISWDQAGNWDQNAVPGLSGTQNAAVVSDGNIVVINIGDPAYTISSLTALDFNDLELFAGTSLTITGTVFGSGGSTFGINGATVTAGSADDASATWNLTSTGALDFLGNVAGSGDVVNFNDQGDNVLTFGDQTNGGTPEFFGSITGFTESNLGGHYGSTIDLKQVAYGSGGITVVNTTGNTWVVEHGATQLFEFASLTLATGMPAQLLAVSDGSGGTDIVVACYHEGTMLLSDEGEVAVEDLVPGMRMIVLGENGARETLPIRWVGSRSHDPRLYRDPAKILPVRIRAGAFAPSMPARDLLVSPDHCILADGVLVPASLLVNGVTVVQEQDRKPVTYYHVELDRHAVMFAEGLPAESYLDTGNRWMFEGEEVAAAA